MMNTLEANKPVHGLMPDLSNLQLSKGVGQMFYVGLTPEQIASLSKEQLGLLSADDLAMLAMRGSLTSEQIAGLTVAQLRMMSDVGFDLTSINGKLSSEQIADLYSAQLSAAAPLDIAAPVVRDNSTLVQVDSVVAESSMETSVTSVGVMGVVDPASYPDSQQALESPRHGGVVSRKLTPEEVAGLSSEASGVLVAPVAALTETNSPSAAEIPVWSDPNVLIGAQDLLGPGISISGGPWISSPPRGGKVMWGPGSGPFPVIDGKIMWEPSSGPFPESPPLGDQAGPTETNLVAPIAALTETNSPSAAEIPVLPASDAAMAATKAATIGSLISAMAGSDFSAYAGNAVISSQVSVVGDSFSPIAGSSVSSMSIGSEQKISSLV